MLFSDDSSSDDENGNVVPSSIENANTKDSNDYSNNENDNSNSVLLNYVCCFVIYHKQTNDSRRK